MIKSVENLNETAAACTRCLEDKLSGTDGKRHIVLCGGTGCLSSHSTEIMEKFRKILDEKGLSDKATVNKVGCFGFCSQGPFVKIFPEETLYTKVKPTDVKEIFEKDILNNEIVRRLLFKDPQTGVEAEKQNDINFYKLQKRDIYMSANG